MNNEQVTTLKEENIIWIICVFLAIGAFVSNNLEINDLETNTNNNRKRYRTINITIFLITLFIYLYFIRSSYNSYNKTKNKRLLLPLIGTILAFIGTTLFLIAEILNFINEEKEKE